MWPAAANQPCPAEAGGCLRCSGKQQLTQSPPTARTAQLPPERRLWHAFLLCLDETLSTKNLSSSILPPLLQGQPLKAEPKAEAGDGSEEDENADDGPRSLGKREAQKFVRAVRCYGSVSRIAEIAAEAGAPVAEAPLGAQLSLYHALLDGCKQARGGHVP